MADPQALAMGLMAPPDDGPVMRAYEPTWRDKIAAMIMGDQRPSPERRRLAEGLMGSSGLGTQGMGLVDFTPAGIPLAGNEMQRAKEEGDWAGVGLNAMAMIPAARAPMQAAKTVAKEAAPGIRAYHGSPHDFDRFDLSKIGTGEGNQSFGHGLYFAENEGVAKSYRDRLLPDAQYKGTPLDAYDFAKDPNGSAAIQVGLAVRDGATPDAAIARSVANYREHAERTAATDPARAARYAQQADEIEKLNPADFGRPNGRMYEVNIKANPEHFLDWDAPLYRQPEAVRRAAGWTPEIEAQYFPALRKETDDLFAQLTGAAPTSPISTARVPRGVTHPEAPGSQIYEGLAANSGAADWPVGADAATRAQFRDNAAARVSDQLKEAGIPGIKYLDQGSRGAGEGSRNYVVFDDSLIEIMRKYGLAGLLGLGAVQGMMQPQPEGM